MIGVLKLLKPLIFNLHWYVSLDNTFQRFEIYKPVVCLVLIVLLKALLHNTTTQANFIKDKCWAAGEKLLVLRFWTAVVSDGKS